MEVPAELVELAQTCLTVSQHIDNSWSAALTSLEIPRSAAGNTPAGPELLATHVTAADAAATAIDRLVGVLETDVDAVYLCAFDFTTTDEANAVALESSYEPQPDWPQPPTPSPGPAPEPTPAPSAATGARVA